jgi:hypothetical protein
MIPGAFGSEITKIPPINEVLRRYTYPARISIPDDLDQAQLRLGMPGSATVFADNAGVIGLLMSILVWISSYAAYL